MLIRIAVLQIAFESIAGHGALRREQAPIGAVAEGLHRRRVTRPCNTASNAKRVAHTAIPRFRTPCTTGDWQCHAAASVGELVMSEAYPPIAISNDPSVHLRVQALLRWAFSDLLPHRQARLRPVQKRGQAPRRPRRRPRPARHQPDLDGDADEESHDNAADDDRISVGRRRRLRPRAHHMPV